MLSQIEISKRIQSKVCKIVTEFGEGSGVIVDDTQGLVLTSFHLVGTVLKSRNLHFANFLPTNDPQLAYDLRWGLACQGYITEPSGLLTEKAFSDVFKGQLNITSGAGKKTMYNHTDGRQIEADSKRAEQWLLEASNNRSMCEIIKRIYSESRINLNIIDGIKVVYHDVIVKAGIIFNKSDPNSVFQNYAYHDAVLIKLLEFEDGCAYGPTGRIFTTGRPISFLSRTDDLPIGADVYFGGYPLTQDEYTFSKGMISSKIIDPKAERIVIEAPVAPGNSGGGVFVSNGKDIFLIGIVSSEVAHITEEIFALKERLEKEKQARGQEHSRAIFQIGGRNVLDEQSQDSHEMLDFLLKNTSTGKAKVTRIYDCDQQLLQPGFIANIDLERCSIEFFVPKKKTKALPPSREQLFEHINRNRLTRLYKKDIINYITINADEATRKIIYQQISPTDIHDHSYITVEFPLETDWNPPDILNRITVPIQNQAEQVSQKDMLKQLYLLACKVSQKKFSNGELVHVAGDAVSVEEDQYCTQKFCRDHIAGWNDRQTSAAAVATAERRSISVSTIMPIACLSALNAEIKNSQQFYTVASETARQEALRQGKILMGLYFLTIAACKMHIELDSGPSEHKTVPFYYSVVPKLTGNSTTTYYLHHFAGVNPKPEWVRQEIPDGGTAPRPLFCEFS